MKPGSPSSQPSSQPSSAPSITTASPTVANQLLENPLFVQWTRQYVQTKVREYAFYYAGYFLVVYLLLLLVDKAGLLKSDALHAECSSSEIYVPFAPMNPSRAGEDHFVEGEGFDGEGSGADPKEERAPCLALEALRAQDCARYQRHSAQGSGLARTSSFAVRLVQRRKTTTGDISLDAIYSEDGGGDIEMNENPMHKAPPLGNKLSLGNSKRSMSFRDRGSSFFNLAKVKLYSDECLEYLALRRCRLGCSDVLYKGGYTVPLIGWRLPPGHMEDFLLYLYNNHTILAAAACASGSDHNRGSRRVVLIISSSISFFMSSLTEVFFRTIGAGPQYSQATQDVSTAFLTQQLADVMLIAPTTLMIARLCKSVYRCDIKYDGKPLFAERYRRLAAMLSTMLLFVGALILLCVCAVLTTARGWWDNILQFTLQVFLVTIVLDLLFAALNFVSEYHFAVHIMYDSLCLVTVGQRYLESLLLEGRAEYADYYNLSRCYFGGLLRVDRVLPREYAERRGWVKVRVRSYVFSEVNPMLKMLEQRAPSLPSQAPPLSSILYTHEESVTRESVSRESVSRESVARDSRHKVERLPDKLNPLVRTKSKRAVDGGPMMGILTPEALSVHLEALASRGERARQSQALREAEEVAAEKIAEGAEEAAEEEAAVEEVAVEEVAAEEGAAEEVQWHTPGGGQMREEQSPAAPLPVPDRAGERVDDEQWEMLYSQSHARHYWRNKATREKTWKNPIAGAPARARPEDASRAEVQTTSMDVAGTRGLWKERARRASMAPADMLHAAAAATTSAQRPDELAQTDVQGAARVWTERVRRASVMAPAAVPMPQPQRGQHYSESQERKI